MREIPARSVRLAALRIRGTTSGLLGTCFGDPTINGLDKVQELTDEDRLAVVYDPCYMDQKFTSRAANGHY